MNFPYNYIVLIPDETVFQCIKSIWYKRLNLIQSGYYHVFGVLIDIKIDDFKKKQNATYYSLSRKIQLSIKIRNNVYKSINVVSTSILLFANTLSNESHKRRMQDNLAFCTGN